MKKKLKKMGPEKVDNAVVVVSLVSRGLCLVLRVLCLARCQVARGDILGYFNQIFDGLCKLFADVDVDVKNGSNLLDRLIKVRLNRC